MYLYKTITYYLWEISEVNMILFAHLIIVTTPTGLSVCMPRPFKRQENIYPPLCVIGPISPFAWWTEKTDNLNWVALEPPPCANSSREILKWGGVELPIYSLTRSACLSCNAIYLRFLTRWRHTSSGVEASFKLHWSKFLTCNFLT